MNVKETEEGKQDDKWRHCITCQSNYTVRQQTFGKMGTLESSILSVIVLSLIHI